MGTTLSLETLKEIFPQMDRAGMFCDGHGFGRSAWIGQGPRRCIALPLNWSRIPRCPSTCSKPTCFRKKAKST